MAMRILRETHRDAGREVLTGTHVGGQPMLLDSAGSGKIRTYNDGAYAAKPFGLAVESNIMNPIQNTTGLTAGAGYDFTDLNRGGLVSTLWGDYEVEFYDDGRGAPYESGDTYVVNAPVYANSSGKITSVATGGKPQVGIVVSFDAATAPTRLRIKSA